ncbi:MAG: CHAT domain-containing protein [Myxococcota bacterium]
MERTARQAALAELWNAAGHEAVLALLARSASAREHELVHELAEQSVECRGTAPEVATKLEQVAGQLSEIHAAMRAAESIDSLDGFLRWQAEAPWRMSASMNVLLATRAMSPGSQWPWQIDRLPELHVRLDRILAIMKEVSGLPVSQRRRRLEEDERVPWPELSAWLAARAKVRGPEMSLYTRLHEQSVACQRLQTPVAIDDTQGRRRLEVTALAELAEPWHRLDAELDHTCATLRSEIVAGQRPLTDALRTVAAGTTDALRNLHRRAYLLYHLLDDGSAAIRRAALEALASLPTGQDFEELGHPQRAIVVNRWAMALELHWHVTADPLVALQSALGAIDRCLPGIVDGSVPRLARDLMLTRARLLRHLAGWREDRLQEAVRAYELGFEALKASPDPILRGRTLAEMAALLRSRRSTDVAEQDRRIRAMYDEALGELSDAVVVRARVLADYAVYLARPLVIDEEDEEHAMALAERAVALNDGLPERVREHPLMRIDGGAHLMTLGNVRRECRRGAPEARREAAAADYRRGLERLGGTDELLAGLLHLDLAFVRLDSLRRDNREEQLAMARAELREAEIHLRPLPVAHARAVVESAMLAVRASPDDEEIRRDAIRDVEAVLHRLPVAADRVVRARVQRQLGELYLGRDGPDDPTRAAEQFVAARGAFVQGGAARLAVEAARDYAESQLLQHADEGDPSALTRGAVVLEQAALLGEQRWARRHAFESTDKLAAMLDGVYGDLAWFQAKLGRPADVVLRSVNRAKRFRPNPPLRALRSRAERSTMLSPAYLDPLARRLPPPTREARHELTPPATPAATRAAIEAFTAANPEAVAVDLTLTRWGSVVVAASQEGLQYAILPLTRETVRRWVWGERTSPGWWRRYLALQQAVGAERKDCERAWIEATVKLARDLGERLWAPALAAVSRSIDGRLVVLAPGRLTGLPFATARIDGKPLLHRARGLLLAPSLAELPQQSFVAQKPQKALCVVADADSTEDPAIAVEELQDVVRLLVSAGAGVDVLARRGEQIGEAVYRPVQARTRELAKVQDSAPTVEAVLQRAAEIDHLYYGGDGSGRGLALADSAGGVARLDGPTIRAGSRWRPGSSVFVSGITRMPGAGDGAAVWGVIEALRAVGAGFMVIPTRAVSEAFARDFSRSFYLYWALGRSLPEACAAALNKVAASDVSRLSAFVVVMGTG